MRNYIFICLLFLSTNLYSKEAYHFVALDRGIGQSILSQIYKKLDIDITFTSLPARRAEKELFLGRVDGEVMRIRTYGDENTHALRVPTSFYYLETMAFVKKDSGIVINSRDDLKKYTLVKIRGIKNTDNLTKGMSRVIDASGDESMMLFLQRRRADIALTNSFRGMLLLKRLNLKDIVPLKLPFARVDLYHYLHQDHKELIPKVDAVIKEMKENGELDILIEKAEQKILNQYAKESQN